MQRTVAAACRQMMTRHSTSVASMPLTNPTTNSTDQQRRGRSLTRESAKFRSNSVDGTTNLVPIERTGNLEERNAAYEELKVAPDNSRREWNTRMPEGHLIVYTDGSFKGNRSGFGIYMGPNHPLNRSQRILTPPHNSQRPEVLAVVQALKNILEWDCYADQPVIVRTDSLNLVQAIAGHACLASYQTELAEIRSLASQIGGSVNFEHVYAHCNDPGNEGADELARQAVVGPTRSRSRSRDRSRERGRSRSRDNDRNHIRTHSANIPGHRPN